VYRAAIIISCARQHPLLLTTYIMLLVDQQPACCTISLLVDQLDGHLDASSEADQQAFKRVPRSNGGHADDHVTAADAWGVHRQCNSNLPFSYTSEGYGVVRNISGCSSLMVSFVRCSNSS
jgi:hypothetical protein